MSKKDWDLKLSYFGKNTLNPLRTILKISNGSQENQSKSRIMLQQGDPTVFGNFSAHPASIRALSDALAKDRFSYGDEFFGEEDTRRAIAEYSSHMGQVTSADVILTSGCSMALEMCFLALANAGDNFLIPRPGYGYHIWFAGSRIEAQYYNLDPFKGWKIDLHQLESLINHKTRAIVVNNPGNPCGNVFSKEHMLEIIDIAERYKLPIIADEIYEFFTFSGVEFHSFASLSKNVPVIVCSGLTKRFIMPGIRMGWLIINDRDEKLKEIRRGLYNICGRNFIPNSTVQLALPKILKSVPQSFFDDNNARVAEHAKKTFDLIRTIPGLRPIMPKGAFYIMVGIDFDRFPTISTSLKFKRLLVEEQNVHVHPCDFFNFTGFFRIVLTPPEELLIEACGRIKEFCLKHYQALK